MSRFVARAGTRVADATCPFHTGEEVYDKADPRHIGRLDAIIQGGASITWENGWRSIGIPVGNLRRPE